MTEVHSVGHESIFRGAQKYILSATKVHFVNVNTSVLGLKSFNHGVLQENQDESER